MPDDPRTLQRLPPALLLLRAGVAVVMGVWGLDKFVNPEHAARVASHFYGVDGLGAGALALAGAAQLVVVLAFAAGFLRTWSYGAVALMHGVSTLSSWARYLDPWENLLFFAAWPMLAACVALFLLREADTWLSVDAARERGTAMRERT